MSSEQFPPPLGNISYPPENTHFNYIDSFVTAWVTPDSSHCPCFLSLYYWNGDPWTSTFNQTIPLNGTKIISLSQIKASGLGQLNLNYVDPVGSHEKVIGNTFNINHDPTQPKAITWNLNALSASSTATSAQSQLPSAASSSLPSTVSGRFASATSVSAPAATPISVSLSPATTHRGVVNAQPTSSSKAKPSSSPQGTEIASITLGTILGVVLVVGLSIFWIRRKSKLSSRRLVHRPSMTPNKQYERTFAVQEADSTAVSKRPEPINGRWELDDASTRA